MEKNIRNKYEFREETGITRRMEECTITTNVISATGSWIFSLFLGLLRQKCSLDVRQKQPWSRVIPDSSLFNY